MRFQTFGPFSLPHLLSLALAVGYLGCNGSEPFGPDDPADPPTAAVVAGSQLTPPSNVNAVATSPGAITITWQDNSTNESKFEIHRSITGVTGAFTLLTSTGADIAAHIDQPLTLDVEHCYRIRSARLTGKKATYSAFSSIACATTPSPLPLAAPSNARAVVLSPYDVTVVWEDNSNTETGFELHRSTSGPTGTFALRATAWANSTGYGESGLSAFGEYCYMIRAVQRTGINFFVSSFSNVACARTTLVPASGVTAIPISSVAVSVQWHAVGSSFRIDRSTDGGASWTVAAGAMIDLRSFAADVPSEQAVCFRVVNYLPTYEAEPSNMACTAAPAAPTVTIIVADGITDVSWIDNSDVEDGYEVWARYDDCYRDWDGVEYCQGTLDFVVAVLPANATSYRLVTGYPYSTTVFAMKDGGRSSGGKSPSP